MKFTKEEISLCKQVAEKHRKEVESGDWVWVRKYHNYFLVIIALVNRVQISNEGWFDITGVIPLWTISDCLGFLKSRSFYGSISDVGSYYETYYKKMIIGENDEDKSIKVYSGIVKTPLEACLKVVLVVLEEGK
jgi:hypothetical protein